MRLPVAATPILSLSPALPLSRRDSDRGFASRAVTLAATAAIVAAAIALQARLGTVDDVSWLITVAEKWLAGGRLYVDMLEINPPASILLYTPAVALAHALEIWPEFVVAASGFAAAGASLVFSHAILRRAGLGGSLGPLTLVVSLVALLILPARAFDERDYFCALFGLPFLAVCAARAAGAPVAAGQAIAAGLLAGAMAALKPPYALVAIAPALWLLRANGWKSFLRLPEFGAALAVGLAYIAAVPIFFPGFIATYMPFDGEVYARLRAPLIELLIAPGPLFCVVMALALVKIAEARLAAPLVVVPALGALGAYAAFLIQGKGWLYQLYPALAFLLLAIATAMEGRERSATREALALCAAIAAGILVYILQAWPLQIAMAVALIAAAAALAQAALSGRKTDPSEGFQVLVLAEMGVAAAIGVAWALFASEGIAEPFLARALASLGPHPTIASISSSLALGHPLAREVGGIWAQRLPALVMTGGSLRYIGEHPDDPGLKEKLAPFIRLEHDALVADIARNRPDAIIVGRRGDETLAWAWADPELTAARADYVFYASDGARWPTEIYARKDLVALRPSFKELAAPQAGR